MFKISISLFLGILLLSITGLFDDSHAIELRDEQIILADAGPDRFNKINTELIFDASISSIPTDIEPVYRWDMGDGTIRFGMRHIYAYNQVGIYKVKLVIEGKNTELIATDEALIHVFDEQLVIFSSDSDVSDSTIRKVEDLSLQNNLAVHNIRLVDNFSSVLMAKNAFIDLIGTANEVIDDSNFIILVGDMALESFLSYKTRHDINLTNKKIIYLLQDATLKSARTNLAIIANHVFDSSQMRLLAVPDLSEQMFDFTSMSSTLYQVNVSSKRANIPVFDFLYRFNTHLLKSGFSLDIIYFLYVMLLISIFSLALRKILGLSVVSVNILGLTIFGFMILGIIPSVIMFTGFFTISYIVQRIYETDRETLFSGNFIDMLMLVFFIIIGYTLIQAIIGINILDTSVFMAILIVGISARRLAKYTVSMKIPDVFVYYLQDILFLTINYFLLTSLFIRLSIISYPEFYLGLIIIMALLLERYRGLRLTELLRFKELFKGKPYVIEHNE